MEKITKITSALFCISLTPILLVSCTTSTNLKLSLSITNEEVDVIPPQTIGHGFDFEGEAKAIVDQDYRCRFISTVYEVAKGLPELPVHYDLKKSDIEVVVDNKNIIEQCSFIHNVLIIPGECIKANKPILINILGGEIADWFTWDEIKMLATADENDEDEPKDLVKDYFQVGDYKKIYHKNKLATNARIIDFYADKFVADEEQYKEKTAAFTFEFINSVGNHIWGGGERATEQWYNIPKWESIPETAVFDLFEENEKMAVNQDFGFTPKQVNIYRPTHSHELDLFSHFFPLSYHDYTGDDLPDNPDSKEDQPIDTGKIENAKYAFYKPSQYRTIQSFSDKFVKRGLTEDFYIRDVDHVTVGTDVNLGGIYRINATGTRYHFGGTDTIEEDKIARPVLWAFCF